VSRCAKTDGWKKLQVIYRANNPLVRRAAIRLAISGAGEVYVDDVGIAEITE
jgi:hypothetical protein